MSRADGLCEPEPGSMAAPDEAPSRATAEARAARREHSYESLLELGHDLALTRDLYETVDLVVFGLMGQLGTGRAALWLFSDDDAPQAVLVRCHGFTRGIIEPLGVVCRLALGARSVNPGTSSRDWRTCGVIGVAEAEIALRAGIEILTPVCVRTRVLGWMALGRRMDGEAYAHDDYRLLDAFLGVVGVSIENIGLYNRVLEANRTLRTANERLSEADRLKSEFLRNVNHELRTPLTVVTGALECLIAMGGADGPERHLHEAALANATRLNGLVENLLTFSQVLDTRLPIELVEADLHETLTAFSARRQPGVAGGLRELTYVPAGGLPRGRFDPQRLVQILDELVDNALKFTQRGAHLRLSLDEATTDENRWLRIRFGDDGPGIPPERMDSLFRSFEQVDGSMTRQVGGLGMGLAFARQLAENMGCRLQVASVMGRGTTFTVLVPAA